VVQAHLKVVGQDYHLIVTVNYEFLHPIQEIFVMKSEKMSEEKIRAAKVEK
jgi:hypothetical protein